MENVEWNLILPRDLHRRINRLIDIEKITGENEMAVDDEAHEESVSKFFNQIPRICSLLIFFLGLGRFLWKEYYFFNDSTTPAGNGTKTNKLAG